MNALIIVTSLSCVLADEKYEPKNKTFEFHDYVPRSDKGELVNMTKEIYIEAKYRLRQLRGVRDKYAKELPFQVGIIIGKCREKYKRMMEIYRDMNDRMDGRNGFYGPGFQSYAAIYPIISMEMIRLKEREIDSMIHVLEVLPRKLFQSKSTTASKPNNRLRNREESEKDKNENMLREKLKDEEQELKRRMKEEYERSHTERVKFELKEDNTSDSKPINWLLSAY